MNARTPDSSQASFEQLVQQVLAHASERSRAGRPHWLRWLMLLGGVFLAWKAMRGLKSLFWTVFGLGMAIFWSGLWRGWF